MQASPLNNRRAQRMTSSKVEQATYGHGHHSSVISVHARRTAANSASFLLPHIKPHHHILDLGCGPGTISADLAALVPEGHLVGIDSVESVLEQARSLAQSRNLTNISYESGDGNALRFSDSSFDIVFCHQVLQHVADPVSMLQEMRRVCKKGGIVAAREADYASFAWYPRPPEFDLWGELYQKHAVASGGEPNGGRYMLSWALSAGWNKVDVTVSWSSWCFTGEDASAWAESWSGRTVNSGFATSVVDRGFGTKDDLKSISEAWKRWAIPTLEAGGYEGCESRIFVVGNGEIICKC